MIAKQICDEISKETGSSLAQNMEENSTWTHAPEVGLKSHSQAKREFLGNETRNQPHLLVVVSFPGLYHLPVYDCNQKLEPEKAWE